ncbi:polysaccharide biosynthesis protein [Rothia sp. P13129]|uniref:polysaccharide biosynthesis protein n=1 Tax=Rothia sp. P13129 TaxID=3402664 RepID=UPI003AC3281F
MTDMSSDMVHDSSARLERDHKQRWIYYRMALDAGAWIAALFIGFFLRYGSFELINPFGFSVVTAIALSIQLGVGYAVGLYSNRLPYGSFAETKLLGYTVLSAVAVIQAVLIQFSWHIGVPRSAILIVAPFALIIMSVFRYFKRMLQEYQNLSPVDKAVPVIVYGAGFLGQQLVTNLLSDPSSLYHPVALVDDDPSLRNQRIQGVPIRGTREDLRHLVTRLGASAVICAKKELPLGYQTVAEEMRSLGVDFLHYAGVTAGVNGNLHYEYPLMRNPELEIDRRIIEAVRGKVDYNVERQDIFQYLQGKRVLVTGAGGSIGSELCRQIMEYEPEKLIMLDRDETLLLDALYGIKYSGSLADDGIVVADIRDVEAVNNAFEEHRPHVVFHVAALKHVAALESNPKEGWKTNVQGTLNILEAASKVEVDVFVNISTDKAADPKSALGQSKRTAERLCSWYGQTTGKKYVSVRFGNVFGSRGSVKPLFIKQIRNNKPLTVTDAEATRFFMLVDDACALVLLAGALGNSGEVLVLDMGQAVPIEKIARQILEVYKCPDLDIQYTGLRDGEKLEEVLFSKEEKNVSNEKNKHISHAHVPPFAPADLDYEQWCQNYINHRGYGRK